MKRRNWIFAGAATAAVAAGVAWQRHREAADLQRQPAAADGAALEIWQLSFEQPDGQPLAMATLRGQPLLLNFWATWCPPCIKEMPDLDRFARRFGAQGWRVLGLAVDNPKAVREFLARSPVSYTIGLAGFEGAELSRKLGNSQGGLPFTVVLDRQGMVSHRKAGATTLDELVRWAQSS